MRPRALHVVLALIFGAAPLLPSGAGAESGAARPRAWSRTIESSAAARHRALAARRLTATAGHAVPGSSTPGGVVHDVREVSRDTLKGPRPSEDDTQVEPSVAVDPNDPDVVVGVVQ